MSEGTDEVILSCEPSTFWPLSENVRSAAVIAYFRECAKEFCLAVNQDAAGDALDLAIGAVAAIGGLFPDTNDESHVLLGSLIAFLTDSMSGRTGHIFMRSTAPMIGLKRGLGHAYIAGYAISAVQILAQRNLLSTGKAQNKVAQLLADAGVSLRKGDHELNKPITAAAIRNWRENPADFPQQHLFADEMAAIHTANLALRTAETLDDVLTYLKKHAVEAVQHSRVM